MLCTIHGVGIDLDINEKKTNLEGVVDIPAEGEAVRIPQRGEVAHTPRPQGAAAGDIPLVQGSHRWEELVPGSHLHCENFTHKKNVRGTRQYCSIYIITRLLWRVSSGGRATEGRGSVALLGRLGRGTGSGNYAVDKTELLHVSNNCAISPALVYVIGTNYQCNICAQHKLIVKLAQPKPQVAPLLAF